MACLALPFSLVLIAPVEGQPGPTRHVKDALDLVKNLHPKATGYEHGTPRVAWNPPCAAHADCSGFIDALLGHSLGYQPADLKTWFGAARPTAADYYREITEQNGFRLIQRFEDVAPGDILSVKYADPKPRSSGHVMLAVSAPRRIPGQPHQTFAERAGRMRSSLRNLRSQPAWRRLQRIPPFWGSRLTSV